MKNVAGNDENFNTEPLSDTDWEGIQEYFSFVELHHALDHLAHTAQPHGVMIEDYKAVQAKASEFFAQLFKHYPANVAREAQSAMSNALFSLEFGTKSIGGKL
jgi:hypothetical protein